jgi:hypothetical protein
MLPARWKTHIATPLLLRDVRNIFPRARFCRAIIRVEPRERTGDIKAPRPPTHPITPERPTALAARSPRLRLPVPQWVPRCSASQPRGARPRRGRHNPKHPRPAARTFSY